MESQFSASGVSNSRDSRSCQSHQVAARLKLHDETASLHNRLTCVFFAFALTISASGALALDRNKSIDQYGHETWTSQNGLPGEAVYQILQTPDGYLWLRTSAGLVRFDGVRFVLMGLNVAGKAVNEPVKAVCKGADGDLLVRTISRTLIYKDGGFTDYRPPAALPDGDIRLIFETKDHEVLIGADDFLYSIQGGAPKMIRRGTGWIRSFLEEDKKEMWVGGSKDLYIYRDGQLLPFTTNLKSFAPSALLGGTGHSIYVGTLARAVPDGSRQPPFFSPSHAMRHHDEVTALLQDREGNFWMGMISSGLVRITDGKAASFKSAGWSQRQHSAVPV